MSDQSIGVNVGENAPAAAKSAKAKPTASGAADTMVQISTTVEPAMKELVRQRAEEEDRTETVILRRALKAFMRDWTPGSSTD